jgi:hypothetical protein
MTPLALHDDDRAERSAGLVDHAGLAHQLDGLGHVLAILIRDGVRRRRCCFRRPGESVGSGIRRRQRRCAHGQKVPAPHHARGGEQGFERGRVFFGGKFM